MSSEKKAKPAKGEPEAPTAPPQDLAAFTQACFAPVGGVELELPPRGPMREPPDFA